MTGTAAGLLAGYGRRVWPTLRLAGRLAEPYADADADAQMRVVCLSALPDALRVLREKCGVGRSYWSRAPILLAAAVTLMEGKNEFYVLTQYEALAFGQYGRMSPHVQRFVHDLEWKHRRTILPTLAKCRRLFDDGFKNDDPAEFRPTPDDEAAAREWVQRAVSDVTLRYGDWNRLGTRLRSRCEHHGKQP